MRHIFHCITTSPGNQDHKFYFKYNTWHVVQKKVLRFVFPKYSFIMVDPSLGQIFFVCTSQCLFRTYCFFQSKKSKLYWRASFISSVNFFEGRSPTLVFGCTLIRKMTSFLIIFPTPAKILWSNNASHTSVRGFSLVFFLLLQHPSFHSLHQHSNHRCYQDHLQLALPSRHKNLIPLFENKDSILRGLAFFHLPGKNQITWNEFLWKLS